MFFNTKFQDQNTWLLLCINFRNLLIIFELMLCYQFQWHVKRAEYSHHSQHSTIFLVWLVGESDSHAVSNNFFFHLIMDCRGGASLSNFCSNRCRFCSRHFVCNNPGLNCNSLLYRIFHREFRGRNENRAQLRAAVKNSEY